MSMNYIYAAAGAALGGVFRYWLTGMMHKYFSIIFPIGTFTVNVLGSFILGLIIFYMDARQLISSEVKIFLTVGFCGGFTTFSAFSYETFALLQQNELSKALLNVIINVVLTIAAVFAAYYLSRVH